MAKVQAENRTYIYIGVAAAFLIAAALIGYSANQNVTTIAPGFGQLIIAPLPSGAYAVINPITQQVFLSNDKVVFAGGADGRHIIVTDKKVIAESGGQTEVLYSDGNTFINARLEGDTLTAEGNNPQDQPTRFTITLDKDVATITQSVPLTEPPASPPPQDIVENNGIFYAVDPEIAVGPDDIILRAEGIAELVGDMLIYQLPADDYTQVTYSAPTAVMPLEPSQPVPEIQPVNLVLGTSPVPNSPETYTTLVYVPEGARVTVYAVKSTVQLALDQAMELIRQGKYEWSEEIENTGTAAIVAQTLNTVTRDATYYYHITAAETGTANIPPVSMPIPNGNINDEVMAKLSELQIQANTARDAAMQEVIARQAFTLVRQQIRDSIDQAKSAVEENRNQLASADTSTASGTGAPVVDLPRITNPTARLFAIAALALTALAALFVFESAKK